MGDSYNRIAKAADHVEELLGGNARQGWMPQLDLVAQFDKGLRVVRRVTRSATVEDLRDALIEVRVGVCLFGMSFSVEAEPRGRTGPDYRAVRGELDFLIEVTRLRSVHEEPPVATTPEEIPEMLPPIGNVERDVRRMRQKIESKFGQLDYPVSSILIVWNDQDSTFEGEAKTAMWQIVEDVRRKLLAPPERLEFLLYSSPWTSCETRRQFHTYALTQAPAPQISSWRAEWEMATVGDLVDYALARGRGDVRGHRA